MVSMIADNKREYRTTASTVRPAADEHALQAPPRPKTSDQRLGDGTGADTVRESGPRLSEREKRTIPSTVKSSADEQDLQAPPKRQRSVIESFRQTIAGMPSEEQKSLDQVLETVRKRLCNPQKEEVQNAYIKLLGLLIHRRKGEFEHPAQVRYFELAVEALCPQNPNTVFASKLIEQLDNYRPRRSNLDPRAAIMFGFVATSLLLTSMFHVLLPEGLQGIRGLVIVQSTFYPLLLMITMAFIGSIVSMLLRIEEFTRMRSMDSLTLLAVTFFRPWIAMSMALFIFAVLKTEIISLGDLNFAAEAPNERAYFILAVIGFISGFSERFARGILERAEERVTPGKPPESPFGTHSSLRS